MYFDSLTALIEMGGHAPYVWSCYAVFLLIVVLNLVWARRQRRQILQQLARSLRRAESGAARPSPVEDDHSLESHR